MLGARIYTLQQDFFNEVTTLLIGLAMLPFWSLLRCTPFCTTAAPAS